MAKGALRRWMYRGQRPNWLARVLNRVSAELGFLGIGANQGWVTLEVPGRASGRTVAVPLVVVMVNGERYLVSMLGENAGWVKNVQAAGGRAVIRSGLREEVRLEEVPVAQRAPILKAYLRRAPGARPHVPVDQDAPLAEFERIASAYPAFRLATPGLQEAVHQASA